MGEAIAGYEMEALVGRSSPWAACAAFEMFLTHGGQCKIPDPTGINWIGIIFMCQSKALDEISEIGSSLAYALAWADLAISMRESLAKSFPDAGAARGVINGAMWMRTNLILKCGNRSGDRICDVGRVVEWCLDTIQDKVEKHQKGKILDSDVRDSVEMLKVLAEKGIIPKEGAVGRALDGPAN